MYYIQDIFVVV